MIKHGIEICRELNKHGFDAHFVGGCIRDMKMNTQMKDIDITTNADPEEVQRIFPSHINTGLTHGTVSVRLDKDSCFYEVTTYRIDGKYDDGRHPDKVIFTNSLKQDLARRDFTMNAIAFDPITETTVDPFNGEQDIKNKLIRCVGNPKNRFMEDPLRVLRAMRFAIKYGFDIEEGTKSAMHDSEVIEKLVECISKERITTELSNMLTSGKPVHDIFMEFSDVISALFPDFKKMVNAPHNNPWHIHDLYEHCVCVIDACETNRFDIKLAAMFHDIGKPDCRTHDEVTGFDHFYKHPFRSHDICEVAFERDLRLSNKDRDNALTLVAIHDIEVKITDNSIRRMIVNYGEDLVRAWLILKKADVSDHIVAPGREKSWENLKQRLNHFTERLDSVLSNMNAFAIRDLAIGGNDVMRILNLKPGPEVGKVLNKLFESVLNNELPNEKTALEQRVRELN